MELSTKYQEFSEFELEQMNVKLKGKESFAETGAVGSAEESLDVKSVIKKYKGVEAKNRTRGTGTGSVKYSLHMNYDNYLEMFGMKNENLIEGVAAYGQTSQHQEFMVTEIVLDEDGTKKLIAYPRCMIKSGPSNKIENASEEVAEIELEVSLMPDEYGFAKYEALYDNLEETVRDKWMKEFTSEMVRVQTA